MPIVGDAKKVLNSMEDTYGSKEKAERVLYATAAKQKRDHRNWKKEAASELPVRESSIDLDSIFGALSGDTSKGSVTWHSRTPAQEKAINDRAQWFASEHARREKAKKGGFTSADIAALRREADTKFPDSLMENWKKEAWELGLGKVAVEILRGGEGDGITADQLDPQALAKGMKEEGEHTSNLALRKEIATDHLAKDRKYYDKLEKMEKKAVAGGVPQPPNRASSTPNVSTRPAPGAIGVQQNQGPGDLAVDPQHRSKTIIPPGGQVGGIPGSNPGTGTGGVAQAQPMTSTASGQPGSPPTQSTGASYGMGPNLPKTAVELRRLGAYAIRYLGGI